MSVDAARSESYAEVEAVRLGEDDRGYGWVMFAAAMLAAVGSVNLIEGIAAISKSHFFVADAHYVFGDMQTWGWVVLFLGVAQGLTALAVIFKNQFARWAGVGFAAFSSIAQLLFIPSYPFWALALFALDILAVYGLVVYGGRTFRPA